MIDGRSCRQQPALQIEKAPNREERIERSGGPRRSFAVRLSHQKNAGSERDCRTTAMAQLRRAVVNASDLQKIRLCANMAVAECAAKPRRVRRNSHRAKGENAIYIKYLLRGGEGVRLSLLKSLCFFVFIGSYPHLNPRPGSHQARRSRCTGSRGAGRRGSFFAFPEETNSRKSVRREDWRPRRRPHRTRMGCGLIVRHVKHVDKWKYIRMVEFFAVD
jgi:hypothetical protein